MNQGNFTKKLTACITAGILTVSTAGAVWAAPSTYKEVETKSLNTLSESLAEILDESRQGTEGTTPSAVADLSLKLEDGGRSLLGFVSPVNLSWLNNVGLHMDVSIQDSIEAVIGNLYLNDTPLLSYQMFVDLLTNSGYVGLPDLADGFLSITASDETASGTSQLNNPVVKALLENPEALIPDGQTGKELLERYGSILIQNMEEGPTSENTQITVADVSEDCTMYEGQLHEGNFLEAAKEILAAARTDEQLKTLIEAWDEAISEEDHLYEDFISGVNETLEELESEQADNSDEEYFAFRVWVNEEGKIIGREIFGVDNALEVPMIRWQHPENGDASGFYLGISEDLSSSYQDTFLTGSGTISSGKLNGTYSLFVENQQILNIAVKDCALEEDASGNSGGSIELSLASSLTSYSEEYRSLANFSILIEAEGNTSTNSSGISVSLLSAGVPLASLNFSAAEGGEAEVPDMQSLTPVYDLDDEDQERIYASGISFDSFLANCRQAGVSDDVMSVLEQAVQELTSSLQASPSEDLYTD